MLLANALAAVAAQLSPSTEQEVVPLARACGRILAADLVASLDVPPWDSSAVDGFALKAADLVPGQVVNLRMVGDALAGHPFEGFVEAGQAVRILTGAQLPRGADMVLMQETCAVNAGTVAARGDGHSKTHWRRQGEDIRAGSSLLPAGRRLRAQDVALAGVVGCRELIVRKPLRVGLFSTGDEVCEPGTARGRGQIWDANRCLLRALLEHMGCEVQDFGILRDEPLVVEGGLSAAAHDCDLLVTSGGMSVGREDHVRSVIGRRGTLDIWPLAIKPGRPVGLGDIDACPILALPGNSVAALVAFAAFGRVVVNVLSGASHDLLSSLVLAADFTLQKKGGVRQFLLGRIQLRAGGGSFTVPCDKQGAAALSGLAIADGFIVLPEDCERVQPDDLVAYFPIEALLG
jgi:molybdopterin molybdotransferase